VILCAISIGAAYVVTLARDYTSQAPEQKGYSDLYPEKAMKSGYDTHFVPVKYYGTSFLGEELQYSVDFQASPQQEAEAHEIVSSTFDQIVPLALVYFF